jgi:hypothetical protein
MRMLEPLNCLEIRRYCMPVKTCKGNCKVVGSRNPGSNFAPGEGFPLAFPYGKTNVCRAQSIALSKQGSVQTQFLTHPDFAAALQNVLFHASEIALDLYTSW